MGSSVRSSWDGTEETSFATLYWRLVGGGESGSGRLPLPGAEFGLDLRPGVVSGGWITLRGMDKKGFRGGVRTAQLDGPLMRVTQSWVVEVQGVRVGRGKSRGRGLRTAPAKGNGTSSVGSSSTREWSGIPRGVALLDTGTAYIMVPDVDTARALYGEISSEIQPIEERGSWGAACETLDRVARDVVISVGKAGRTVDVKVARDFFNLGEYPGKSGVCQALFLNPLQPAREPLQGRPAWVLGSPFVKGYYTVWNGRALTIGFAQRSDDGSRGGWWSWPNSVPFGG